MAHNVGLYPLTPPAPVATEALGASDSVMYQRHESHMDDFALWRPLSAQGSEQVGVMMGSTLAGDRAYSVTARGSAGGQQRVVRRGGRRGERRGGNTQHSGAAATKNASMSKFGVASGVDDGTHGTSGRGNIVRIDKTIRTPLRRSIPTQPSTTTDPVRSTRIREQPNKNKHRSRIRAGRTAAGPVRKAHAQQSLSPTARRHGTRRRRAFTR